MAYDATGAWINEDDSVQTQLKGILQEGSPLMDVARTDAAKSANRRGLINSSMAAGAGTEAMIRTATPIASQTAQQIAQKNLAKQQTNSTEEIARMNVAAHDREKATAATTAMQQIYSDVFKTLANNQNLPAATRDQYLESARAESYKNLNLIEQLYGVDLDWGQPAA